MLQDGKVTLGPLERKDSAVLFEWINDRDTVLFGAGYGPVHDVLHEKWFEGVMDGSGGTVFAIREDDRLVGMCQLLDVDPVGRTAEARIRIGHAADRGRGVGSRALGLLVRHAFEDMNLQRLVLYVLGDNERALRLYESAGFVHEGTLRRHAYVDGAYKDVVVLGLLREDA